MARQTGCEAVCPSPDVAMNYFLHIIVSFLEISFWNPLRGVNERVRTFVYFLTCTAGVVYKSTETKRSALGRIPDTSVFSAASLAVPPFTSWVRGLT